MELILASQSPRRRELFSLVGLDYTAITSDADENIPFTEPGEFVEQLALRKASAVKKDNPGACVVGADTIVWLNGEIIGKPRDPEDAVNILKKLSGKTHTVYTGVAVLTDQGYDVCHDTTEVTMEDIPETDIRAYVASGEPLDKAGAYGIQGPAAVFVKRVEGCYFTVIGMPMHKLYHMLAKVGIYPDWQRAART